jgi:hypothetical protein
MNNMTQIGVSLMLMLVIGSGCAHMGGRCDLSKAAKDAQLQNVTTSDATFETHNATGRYTSTEIGIAVGIPFIKMLEVYPQQDDTAQMTQIAKAAKKDGATAVVDAIPPKGLYTGFPFFFIGIYYENASGTGIKSK